jgi:hypothetical protein
MANSDKNIVITPNKNSAADNPKIVFSGADAATGPQNITLTAYPLNSGTVSFDGSAGQLFSLTNTLSGTIFSVNDISGIPNIEVLENGNVRLAQYNGRVILGNAIDNEQSTLQVSGAIPSNSQLSGTMVVSGGVGISGDVYAGNIYSNGIQVIPGGGVSEEQAIAYSVVFGG